MKARRSQRKTPSAEGEGYVVTSLLLPKGLHEALRERAHDLRRPMAELVREAVRRYLEEVGGDA